MEKKKINFRIINYISIKKSSMEFLSKSNGLNFNLHSKSVEKKFILKWNKALLKFNS